MKKHLLAVVTAGLALMMGAPARAGVAVQINLAAQRMTVIEDGAVQASWRISSGRRGYTTPSGIYRPYNLERMHYSRKYDNAPMPWSIFYRGGYAIHGTNATKSLGRPASHGCIRLAPGNARSLYGMVKQNGKGSTRIYIGRNADHLAALTGRTRYSALEGFEVAQLLRPSFEEGFEPVPASFGIVPMEMSAIARLPMNGSGALRGSLAN